MKNFAISTILLTTVALMGAPLLTNADIINRQLEVGMRGTDISAMQTFFAADTTIYPQGIVSGYFGFLTKAAVSNFQSKNGISSVGRVGPATLPVLNAQMASGMHAGADIYAPLITSVNVNFTSTTATINWTTNDIVRGKMFYSTSPIMLGNTFDTTGINFVEPFVSGTLSPSYDGIARSAQSAYIGGLTPNTTYYYLIEAIDASNNVSITNPASFRTSN